MNEAKTERKAASCPARRIADENGLGDREIALMLPLAARGLLNEAVAKFRRGFDSSDCNFEKDEALKTIETPDDTVKASVQKLIDNYDEYRQVNGDQETPLQTRDILGDRRSEFEEAIEPLVQWQFVTVKTEIDPKSTPRKYEGLRKTYHLETEAFNAVRIIDLFALHSEGELLAAWNVIDPSKNVVGGDWKAAIDIDIPTDLLIVCQEACLFYTGSRLRVFSSYTGGLMTRVVSVGYRGGDCN